MDQDLHDALMARINSMESGADPEARRLICEWTAIEKNIPSREVRITAFKALFCALASHYSALARQHQQPIASMEDPAPMSSSIRIETSPGELIDRLTILEIKMARISEPAKVENVRREYQLLASALVESIPPSEALNVLRADLKTVNEALWQIEDDIRDLERAQQFGDSFVALARSVYRTNDQRAAIKRSINDMLASGIVEEKSYAPY